jgi:hypothetical protein
MAATVLIRELNGTGENATDKTSGTVRFKSADNATVDTNNRLTVPTAGTSYSYRKVLRLNVSVAPDVDIDDLEAYTDGSSGFGSGVKVWYAVTSSYTQPSVPSTSNDPPEFPGTTAMADLFAATTATPIDMDGNNTGPFTGTGDIGDYLNLVMEVETGASPGTLSAETLTLSFLET